MFGVIQNPQGEALDYSFAPGIKGARTLVVIGHGVTANKDREWALTLSQALMEAGFASLRFSFSGNGNSEGSFEESCPSKGAGDLRAILDAVHDCSVIYVGHSMGAAVGVMVAAEDERLQGLVSLAGMVHTAEFSRRKFGEITPGKDCMWGKPECPLSQIFLDDMVQLKSLQDTATSIHIPWLLIHGDVDSVVPLEESVALEANHRGSRELITLRGADHIFSDAAAGQMAQHVVNWLQKNFSSPQLPFDDIMRGPKT